MIFFLHKINFNEQLQLNKSSMFIDFHSQYFSAFYSSCKSTVLARTANNNFMFIKREILFVNKFSIFFLFFRKANFRGFANNLSKFMNQPIFFLLLVLLD